VIPTSGFIYEGYCTRTATTKEDCRNGYACRVFPILINRRTLACRCGEASVCMSARLTRCRVVYLILPVDSSCRAIVADTFPPNIAVGSQTNVGEDGVLVRAVHSVGVSFQRGERSYAKETCLGVDGVQLSVCAELHPCNIVAHAFHLPTGKSGNKHCQIGFSASTWESCSNIFLLAFRVGNAKNQHVFSQPFLLFCHV